jgi:hypothetical protein
VRKPEVRPEARQGLRDAFDTSRPAGYSYTRALLEGATGRDQLFSEASEVFLESVRLDPPERREVIRSMVDTGGKAGSLFLVQNISGLTRPRAREYMADFLEAGGQVTDVASWLELAGGVLRRHNVKRSGTAGAAVDALGDAADWVVDTLEDGVDALLEGIDAVIDALTSAGASIVDLFEEVVSWTADQIGNLLAALIEAGIALGEYVGAVFDWTYRAVATFIEAAFAVGFTIADLLETVVSESYFVLRRFINGIIQNLGPLGEILDFVLSQAEGAFSELWRRTLLALRYARARMLDVVDWMATQTQAAVTAIVNAWESIGEDLIALYEAALAVGAFVWEMIGEATATIGNSIYYAYNFLATSGVEFVFAFTRGLLRAGQAIAGVIGWAIDQTIEICAAVVRAAIEIGTTIATMLVAVVQNPSAALRTFLQALASIGQSLEDVLRAAIIDTAAEFLDEVIAALREIGNAVVDLCVAALRLGGAALATLVAALFNLLGTYRALTAAERADARAVFGSSLDYDLVFVSTEDPLNEIIFGLQDFFTGNPDSRAFVTTNLVNFDVDDGQIDRPTLIHELTHVWQAREVGGIYMAEAIAAQAGAGYNYGYRGADRESLGAPDGTTTVFSGTLSLPITPATVCLVSTDGTNDVVLARDDGAGNVVFTDTADGAGTVDYATGSFSVTFTSAPASGPGLEVWRRVTLPSLSGGGSEEVFEAFILGVDAEAALTAAGGDFEQFNREQQGQVTMHWFARSQLAAQDNNGDPLVYDASAWQPYRDFVRAA